MASAAQREAAYNAKRAALRARAKEVGKKERSRVKKVTNTKALLKELKRQTPSRATMRAAREYDKEQANRAPGVGDMFGDIMGGLLTALDVPGRTVRSTIHGVGATMTGGLDEGLDTFVDDMKTGVGMGELYQSVLEDTGLDDTFLGNEWVKRGVGFAGDVATDPLSYLAPTAALKMGAKNVATDIATKGAETAALKAAASKGIDLADDVARKAVEKEAQQAARQVAAKVAKKGVHSLTKDELALYDLGKGGIAWNMPGTGRVARKLGLTDRPNPKQFSLGGKALSDPLMAALNAAGAGWRGSAVGKAVTGKLGGAETKQALDELLRSGDPQKGVDALLTQRIAHTEDLAAEAWLVKNLDEYGKLSKQFRGHGDEVVKAVEGDRVAQESLDAQGVPWRDLNTFLNKVHHEATDQGVRLGFVTEGEEGAYVPHALTDEALAAEGKFGTSPTGRRKYRAGEKLPDGTELAGTVDDIRRQVEAYAKEELGLSGDYYVKHPDRLIPHYLQKMRRRVSQGRTAKRIAETGVGADFGQLRRLAAEQRLAKAGQSAVEAPGVPQEGQGALGAGPVPAGQLTAPEGRLELLAENPPPPGAVTEFPADGGAMPMPPASWQDALRQQVGGEWGNPPRFPQGPHGPTAGPHGPSSPEQIAAAEGRQQARQAVAEVLGGRPYGRKRGQLSAKAPGVGEREARQAQLDELLAELQKRHENPNRFATAAAKRKTAKLEREAQALEAQAKLAPAFEVPITTYKGEARSTIEPIRTKSGITGYRVGGKRFAKRKDAERFVRSQSEGARTSMVERTEAGRVDYEDYFDPITGEAHGRFTHTPRNQAQEAIPKAHAAWAAREKALQELVERGVDPAVAAGQLDRAERLAGWEEALPSPRTVGGGTREEARLAVGGQQNLPSAAAAPEAALAAERLKGIGDPIQHFARQEQNLKTALADAVQSRRVQQVPRAALREGRVLDADGQAMALADLDEDSVVLLIAEAPSGPSAGASAPPRESLSSGLDLNLSHQIGAQADLSGREPTVRSAFAAALDIDAKFGSIDRPILRTVGPGQVRTVHGARAMPGEIVVLNTRALADASEAARLADTSATGVAANAADDAFVAAAQPPPPPGFQGDALYQGQGGTASQRRLRLQQWNERLASEKADDLPDLNTLQANDHTVVEELVESPEALASEAQLAAEKAQEVRFVAGADEVADLHAERARLLEAATLDGNPHSREVAVLEAQAASTRADLHELVGPSGDFTPRQMKLLYSEQTYEQVKELVREGAWRKFGVNPKYAADKDLVDVVELMGRKMHTHEQWTGFLRQYDKMLGYIKAWQVGSPGFVTRNFMGDLFNGYLADMDVGAYRRFWKARNAYKKGTLADPQQLAAMEAIQPYLGAHEGQFSAFELRGFDTPARKAQFLNPLSSRNAYLRGVEKGGAYVNELMRGSMMFDSMMNGGTVEDAVERMYKFHFDYDDLSEFEKGSVKRIIPFYTWTRKNLPLQLEMLVKRPGKFSRYAQFKSEMEQGVVPDAIVPSYYTDLFGMQTPVKTGGGSVFLTPQMPFTSAIRSLIPIDDEGFSVDEQLSMVNPMLKTPVELFAGKQFYKDFPLTDERVPLPGKGTIIDDLLAVPLRAAGQLDEKGRIKESTLYALQQHLPLLGRLRRQAPSEKRYQDRVVASWLSFLGVPVRVNTKNEQRNERLRRKYKNAKKVTYYLPKKGQ